MRALCVSLQRPMVRNANADYNNCELPETECAGHKTQTDRQTDHKADSTQAQISSATNRYIIADWLLEYDFIDITQRKRVESIIRKMLFYMHQ